MKNKIDRVWNLIKEDLWIVILDILSVNASYFIALIFRLSLQADFKKEILQYKDSFFTFAPIYTVICIVAFFVFRLYSGLWRYASIYDMSRIVLANIVTAFFQVIGTLLIVDRMPISYYVTGALFQFLMVSFSRFAYRIIVVERRKLTNKQADVLIIGGGEEAYSVHKVLDSGITYRPVGFVYYNSKGSIMDGLPVYKTIEEAIEYREVECVFITDLSLNAEDKRKIRDICKQKNIEVKDYTNFFSYSYDSDALLGTINSVTKTQYGKHIIPFSPPDIGDNEIGEVVETLRSGWITTGPRTKLLERRLAAFIETGKTNVDTESEPDRWKERVVCLASATAAEELNLRILGVRPGDEVIVPAYTYTASASAAIHCGATVKFVDIQRDGDKTTHSPEMDYGKLEEAITDKTKAIIPVDNGGIVCDYDKIYKIVERKKALFTPLESDGTPLGNMSSRIQKSIGRVAVVADCAHSLGASRVFGEVKKYCGAIADFSSFSFIANNRLTSKISKELVVKRRISCASCTKNTIPKCKLPFQTDFWPPTVTHSSHAELLPAC